ncbi:MAG: hypothetical protein ABR880_01090 [Candidatus Sulfotelmatobacter sp.]|jgi:hypothetical protein
MSKTQLHLKEVPSVPGLKTGEITTGSGHKFHVFSADSNSVQFVPANGNLKTLGGITVGGPGAVVMDIDWDKVIGIGIAVGKAIFGGGGEVGGGGQTCKTTTTVTTDGKGNVTSVSTSMSCTPN